MGIDYEEMISIHAAREGGDQTLPKNFKTWRISIHAAREGGDVTVSISVLHLTHFNPRRP